MTHTVYCQKMHQESEGLEKPPYPGQLGLRIYEHISKEAWHLWLAHQTMLINEYRFNLIDPKAREFLEKEMKQFLFADDA